ncbi:ribonuclease III [Legionella impletisoli]|uniref:Ribonuclease 3 n=1 Tax=Legionella impletisoli TaxID=343510 RepID=A0A917NBE2_9GAMM|nr:ribonuclease III [Legionella impletisoli]GGI85373.1 ribonuclease 3 [Legionella impletisoli]
MVEINLQRLCRTLDYRFNNLNYLKQALTHCSAGAVNYERLEFLGDSILSFVISNALYEQFKHKSEGELSRLRAYLVKGEMLAEIALEINLGDYLYLGQGELKSGGFRRASILADALEAVFAAVFLDGGIEPCQHVILNLFKSRLDDDGLHDNLKDPKTQLQEFLQAKKIPLPNYTLLKIKGEEHDQEFHIRCEIPDLKLTTLGQGPSRRKAEQRAAKEALKLVRTIERPST